MSKRQLPPDRVSSYFRAESGVLAVITVTKAMSIFASILRAVYRLSGVKKSFTLPENELRKEIEKQNRHRGVFTPTDHKAYYEMDVAPYENSKPIYYEFTACPAADATIPSAAIRIHT